MSPMTFFLYFPILLLLLNLGSRSGRSPRSRSGGGGGVEACFIKYESPDEDEDQEEHSHEGDDKKHDKKKPLTNFRRFVRLDEPLYYGSSVKEFLALCLNHKKPPESEMQHGYHRNEFTSCPHPKDGNKSDVPPHNMTKIEVFLLKEAQAKFKKQQDLITNRVMEGVAWAMFIVPFLMFLYLIIVGHYRIGNVALFNRSRTDSSEGVKYNLYTWMRFRILPGSHPEMTRKRGAGGETGASDSVDPTKIDKKQQLRERIKWCKYDKEDERLDPKKITIDLDNMQFRFRQRVDYMKLIALENSDGSDRSDLSGESEAEGPSSKTKEDFKSYSSMTKIVHHDEKKKKKKKGKGSKRKHKHKHDPEGEPSESESEDPSTKNDFKTYSTTTKIVRHEKKTKKRKEKGSKHKHDPEGKTTKKKKKKGSKHKHDHDPEGMKPSESEAEGPSKDDLKTYSSMTKIDHHEKKKKKKGKGSKHKHDRSDRSDLSGESEAEGPSPKTKDDFVHHEKKKKKKGSKGSKHDPEEKPPRAKLHVGKSLLGKHHLEKRRKSLTIKGGWNFVTQSDSAINKDKKADEKKLKKIQRRADNERKQSDDYY